MEVNYNVKLLRFVPSERHPPSTNQFSRQVDMFWSLYSCGAKNTIPTATTKYAGCYYLADYCRSTHDCSELYKQTVPFLQTFITNSHTRSWLFAKLGMWRCCACRLRQQTACMFCFKRQEIVIRCVQCGCLPLHGEK